MMKVFLVDDEIAIRENLRNSFPWEQNGFQLVGEAPDGEMALPMIRDTVDIKLADLGDDSILYGDLALIRKN